MTDTPQDTPPTLPAEAQGGTAKLIASDRVEGTAVYDPSGNKLGAIERLMIDKVAGRVEYAVLSFGGFLGFNASHYPLPWGRLRYDTGLGGYVVDVTEAQLAAAPSYPRDQPVDWSDQGWGETLRGHYGPSPYGSRDGL
ncbi:PRC-barrel domain-containing protein [Teichococcus cervicalis]|nr:PRC-barrel domain-containing protein [Pseudoroseomonas cervicalis]